MATRIIVKNLPPYLTQDQFSKHFRSHSTPTDTKLQVSKSGRTRRFGFIGFQTSSEAHDACQYWNNTYIGSTKVSAELARTVEEEAQTNYKRKFDAPDALAIAQAAQVSKKRRTDDNRDVEDPKLAEFLRLNSSRSKNKTFLNDDEAFQQVAAEEEEEVVAETEERSADLDTRSQAREAYQIIEHEPENEEPQEKMVPAVAEDADDAEWLRNRTSRILDLDTEVAQGIPALVPTQSTSQLISTTNDSPLEEISKVSDTKTEEQSKAEARAAAIEQIKETSRLFLRNLAYSVEERDLREVFEAFGVTSEVHMPQDKDGKSKGTAFIAFLQADAAIEAFSQLDGTILQGRLLHIIPAQTQLTIQRPLAPGQKLNVGEKRKEERRKEASKFRFNWNALYLNQNAVLDNIAKKFGISKSELLDPTQSNSAVVMALAESSALGAIKKFFTDHGVNLEAFANTREKDDSIILFKNLPASASETELRKLVESSGGNITQIIMPEIGGLAIIELVDAANGRMVFKKLAYRKFGDGLLYLEKGPSNALSSAARLSNDKVDSTDSADETEDQSSGEQHNVFVKNLNFDTTPSALTRIFESLKGFRSATLKTKPSPKNPDERLSMGFGFADFASHDDARAAISALQGFQLDGHALELKLSDGKSNSTKPVTKGKGNTKVIVKNLPFETTKADVQKLFSTYGTLKSLRLPKKYNSHLRGFAFLEFVSKREAANAIAAITGTHLLGRRLVIEYAESELTGDEGIEQLIAKTSQRHGAVEAVEKGRRKTGKINLDGIEEGFED